MIGLIRKLIPETPQEQKPQQLTRDQRRMMDRLNKEVNETLAQLVNLWYQFFLQNDPEGNEVKNKKKEVSAKWRVFCERRHLKSELKGLADKAIDQLMDEYRKQRKGL